MEGEVHKNYKASLQGMKQSEEESGTWPQWEGQMRGAPNEGISAKERIFCQCVESRNLFSGME